MRRSRTSALVVLAGCGAAAHPAPSRCDRPVVLADQADVTAVAACTSLPAVTIRTGGALDTTRLTALATITGDLVIGPTAGIDSLTLPALTALGGTLHVANNGLLQGAFFPGLARAGRIEIDNNAALTTLSLPALTAAGAFVVTDNAALEVIEAARFAGQIVVTNAPRLSVFEHAAGD